MQQASIWMAQYTEALKLKLMLERQPPSLNHSRQTLHEAAGVVVLAGEAGEEPVNQGHVSKAFIISSILHSVALASQRHNMCIE